MVRGCFDGASRGNPGEACAGAFLEDQDGKVLWECSQYLGVRTNNEAEYEALLRLLEEARRRGVAELEVCGDSRLVVCQVNRQWKINLPHLRELAKQAWTLMEGMEVSLTWVPREKNSRADELSNEALKNI